MVLAALRGEDTPAFDALLASGAVTPQALDELGSTEHGVAWSDVPPSLVPDDLRLRILHTLARMQRYDGSALHLDVALFEQLVRAFEADELDWADVARRGVLQLAGHVGEISALWPQARSLQDRFPDQLATRPSFLGMVANIASQAGAPEAADLWQRVLEHPNLGDVAEQRLELELDWARTYLLHLGGDPRRGITVLERVRRGFAELSSPIAMLQWTDATMELVGALTWTGRCADALEIAIDAPRHVEPASELELWLRAIAAYPAAHVGDEAAMCSAFEALDQTCTDTAGLELRAMLPARMVDAARRGDLDGVRRAVADATRLDGSRQMDPDFRYAWRIHGAETLVECGARDEAVELLDELRQLLDAAPAPLPVHRLRYDAVRAGIDASVPTTDLARRARGLGVDLDALGLARSADDRGLRVRVVGRFAVEHDGAAVADEAWRGRRQAKLLLALLLLDDGSVRIDRVADVLWGGDVDPDAARNRIAPLCHSIRSVLAAAGPATPTRELQVRGGAITLQLHPTDGCELQQLRMLAAQVTDEPARVRAVGELLLRDLNARALADLGSDVGANSLRDAIERELLALVPRVALAWSGCRAPDVVVDVVERVFEIDPADVDACRCLVRLHADRGNAPAASAAFHRTRNELRDQLGMSVPRSLARLHASILEAEPAAH